ncbi:hypothetical protein EU537_00105 [Candidatus Thorarchaeota archaeon]|nr:MAG: hypothetical protein EU537_00105 [Candidatus Thorarchaeota archaeon]
MTRNELSIKTKALQKDFGPVLAVRNLDLQVATGSRFGLLIAVGSSMIAIGVTAKNPDYEDTKSPAHQTNQMTAMMLPMVCIMASVFILIALSILDLDVVIENALSPIGFQLLFSLTGPFIILLVGVAYVSSGIKSLSAPA